MVKNLGRTSGLFLFAFGVSLALLNTAEAAGRVFYDSFESGNTNQWDQDEYRNRCQVVTSAADGGAAPFSGSRMLRCGDDGTKAWNDAAAYESLALDSINYTNELFIRTKMRRDSNLQITTSSPKKIMRIFNWTGNQSTYNDLYESFYSGSGLVNTGIAGGSQLATYWGGRSGDNTTSSSGWHEIEYYISKLGVVKVWHDGVLVQSFVGLSSGNAKWTPFTITSNWSDAHDALNYIYFDEFEVFTDNGTGATGSMSDGTVSASGSPVPISAPTNLRVN